MIKKLNCKLNKFKILGFLASILLISAICFCFYIFDANDAYANGFTKTNMVCSGFEKYKSTLCVGIFPIVLRGGSADNFSIKFELVNNTNKSIFPNATYITSVIKNEYDTNLKDRTILSGTFNSRNGFLTLYINASGKQELEQSKKEEVLPILSPSIRADRINLTLPFKFQSGQYKVQSVVFVQNKQPLYFDSVLQVGDIKSKNIFSNKK